MTCPRSVDARAVLLRHGALDGDGRVADASGRRWTPQGLARRGVTGGLLEAVAAAAGFWPDGTGADGWDGTARAELSAVLALLAGGVPASGVALAARMWCPPSQLGADGRAAERAEVFAALAGLPPVRPGADGWLDRPNEALWTAEALLSGQVPARLVRDWHDGGLLDPDAGIGGTLRIRSWGRAGAGAAGWADRAPLYAASGWSAMAAARDFRSAAPCPVDALRVGAGLHGAS